MWWESHWSSAMESPHSGDLPLHPPQHFSTTLCRVLPQLLWTLILHSCFAKYSAVKRSQDALQLQTIKMLLRPFELPFGKPWCWCWAFLPGTQKWQPSCLQEHRGHNLLWCEELMSTHGKHQPWAGSKFRVGTESAFPWLDPDFYLSCATLFVLGTNHISVIMRGPACTLYSSIPVSYLGLWGDVITSVQMGAEECDVTNLPGPPNKLKSRLPAQKGYPPK